jgi:beta-galactosidase/beta-glucuronidase
MTMPRPEYPRPQFARPHWQCLNGQWQFEIDAGDTGLHRGLLQRDLQSHIIVPFCPESPLSGIGNTDYLNAVWYRRDVVIPSGWAGQRILLHFQAVDYDTTVWVDGREVARHRGGWTPFSCELTAKAQPEQRFTIVVRARDDHRQPKAQGKQSARFHNERCHYTRTTGIWQTVWMEPVSPRAHLQRARITPDVAAAQFHITQPIRGDRRGLKLRATLSDDNGRITSTLVAVDVSFTPTLTLPVPEQRLRLWSTRDPHLYTLTLELIDDQGQTVDHVSSYAGLRSVVIEGKAVLINGEPVFQRLVLDQGYYPDGIMTAPSDQALQRDIELSIEAGFNGARLHQKVFEERFLYHADRMGYLVWGEFGDWGCAKQGHRRDHQKPTATYITQWLEALQRDYSHPCIIGWCPMNETYQPIHDHISTLDDVTLGMFLATKAFDQTRPVIDASGYAHRVHETDIYDSHDYAQDPNVFAANHAGLAENMPYINGGAECWSLPYAGQPFFVSEFGGIWWNPEAAAAGEASWGYGDRPRTIEEFYRRFEGLCNTLLQDRHMFGYCYTQLTDVYQEQNGIYHFDRTPKFDLQRLRRIQTQSAAIERTSQQADLRSQESQVTSQ